MTGPPPSAPAGRRRWILAGLGAAGILAAWAVGIRPSHLRIEPARWSAFLEFLEAAATPALRYEAKSVPPGTIPFLHKVAQALLATVQFAGAAVSLALAGGAVLATLASRVWWEEAVGCGAPGTRRARLARWIQHGVRVFCIGLRSVHELIWAILLLAAFGRSPLVAVAAISLPYAGTFGKVFSEILDETPARALETLRYSGASSLPAFCCGLLPRALPDLFSYLLYRFECGLRSAAVLGFIGIPTAGYYLKLSFDSLHYREVWTYLYALLALVLLVDLWSGAVRRRLQVRSIL